MQHLEVSWAVQHIYIYIYVIRRLRVKRAVYQAWHYVHNSRASTMGHIRRGMDYIRDWRQLMGHALTVYRPQGDGYNSPCRPLT